MISPSRRRGRRGTMSFEPRRNRGFALVPVVLLAIVVVVGGYLVYSWFFGGGCSDQYCASDRHIAAPPGYVILSEIFIRREGAPDPPEGMIMEVSLELNQATLDSRNLSIYRYVEDTRAWEPAAAGVLDPQGRAVTAALQDAPDILAVLRRESAAGHVVGYVPHDATLHPDAAGRLTILHTQDFRPTADGSIEGSPSAVALEPGTAWYPSLWADAENGANVFVEAALASATSRSNHVRMIQQLVTDLGLQGIDIAYFDLPATSRDSFTLFAAEISQSLHGSGKILTLTLPCPLLVQERIDDGAYDWAELGKLADVIQMAPCRDQSVYRRDLPLILEHLTSLIEPSKLVLTVTPYASEKSIDGIRTMSVADAMTTALAMEVATPDPVITNSNVNIVGINIDRTENLTGVTWDPSSATVAFTYKLNGGRTVWIENVFSVGFKLEFVSQYGLGGVGIEDASNNVYLGDIWPALIPFITSGQPVLAQPNGADLIPRWSISRGELEEGAPGRGVVKWLTPAEPGTYTITLILSDGVAQFENELSVEVAAPDQPTDGTSGQDG